MLFLEDSSIILFTNNTGVLPETAPEEPQPTSETGVTASIPGGTVDFTPDRIANVEVLALAASEPTVGGNITITTGTLTIDDGITIQGSPIIYVRPGGGGSGTSWGDAYGSLQTAIDNAPAGSEIWVAAGTYVPSSTGDRNASFTLKDQIEIYGGFGGFETDRGQRNIGANGTILSGDIGAAGNNTDNSYHVVSVQNIPNYAILDGFTIAGGNANQRNTNDDGGGIVIRSSRATFANLVITGNSAGDRGGGIYTNSIQSQFTNVVLISNSASQGGAMFFDDTIANDGITRSEVTLTNSTFSQNTARSIGGGIRSFRTQLNIFGTVFERNTAEGDGGGLFGSASTINVTNSTFSNNISRATTTNIGVLGGGAINASQLTVTSSIFWGNQAVENSQIGLAVRDDPKKISNSIIQGGFAGGVSINDADPLFVDAASGNLALQAGSPARDRGDNGLIPAGVINDITGRPRISNGVVDLGAYEFFAFDAAQYGASNPDLIPFYGADLAGLTNHYLTFGRFENRQLDSFDEFRYIASSYVTGGDLITGFGLDGGAATLHYLSNGFNEMRSRTAFVPSRYLNSYPDDLSSLGTDTARATQHFITNGFAEGRDPNLFASDRYIASYPNDLIGAFGYNLEAGSDHYLVFGRGENRFISFDPFSYMNLNPDVAQGVGGDPVLATRHYITDGFREMRPT
jgi:predicted outer membrane repeat protein